MDFRQEFDSMHKGWVLKSSKNHDISSQLFRAASKFHENTRTRVTSLNGETEYFEKGSSN